jgi:hypothetical protein
MILVIFNDSEILGVTQAPLSGITQTINKVIICEIEEAIEYFTTIKNFDVSKIENYKKNLNYE